jgi:hypothetical protein
MNINGPNDLYNFLIRNGLAGMCPESQNLVTCMDILVRMCACEPPQAKQDRYNQCKRHYTAFACRSQNFAYTLLSKTNDNRIQFYLNNQIISTLSR